MFVIIVIIELHINFPSSSPKKRNERKGNELLNRDLSYIEKSPFFYIFKVYYCFCGVLSCNLIIIIIIIQQE